MLGHRVRKESQAPRVPQELWELLVQEDYLVPLVLVVLVVSQVLVVNQDPRELRELLGLQVSGPRVPQDPLEPQDPRVIQDRADLVAERGPLELRGPQGWDSRELLVLLDRPERRVIPVHRVLRGLLE